MTEEQQYEEIVQKIIDCIDISDPLQRRALLEALVREVYDRR